MKTLLETTPILWEELKKVTKPIALYGMGTGADKILNVCEQEGIPVAAIFASDNYVRRDIFRGYEVKPYSQAYKEIGDMVILLAFGSQRPEVLAEIASLEAKHTLYVPDVPVFGEVLFSKAFFEENLDKFQAVYDLLEEEHSRKSYENLLRFKLSGNPNYLREIVLPREEMYQTILPLGEKEIYVDAGAYNGDTILEFLGQTDGKYQEITAIEPSTKNYHKLIETMKSYGNVTLFHAGVWNKKDTLYFGDKGGRNVALQEGDPDTEVDTIDNFLVHQPATFIKYDVEGAEKEALEGTAKTITKYSPKLVVSIYHRSEDLFAIPLQIQEMNPNYHFHIRHNPYLPAWDIHLIATPKEK